MLEVEISYDELCKLEKGIDPVERWVERELDEYTHLTLYTSHGRKVVLIVKGSDGNSTQ